MQNLSSLSTHEFYIELAPNLPLGLLDSGTTRTRLRLWDGQKISWQGERIVGARDRVRDGNTKLLIESLKSLLNEIPIQERPNHLVCSGMITSNLGLLEVPCVQAPAGPEDVARGLKTLELTGLPPITLIPGIVTVPNSDQTWLDADVLRGEEVEIFGLRELLNITQAHEFLHLGSHHKWLQTNAAGQVVRSVTSLAGEALHALGTQTVLAHSITPMNQVTDLNHDIWLEGLHTSQSLGIGRALFLVRLGKQNSRFNQLQATAFFYGTMAALTLDVLSKRNPNLPLTLYGHEVQAKLLASYLQTRGETQIHFCSAATVEKAAVQGAIKVLQARQVVHG
jgi:2-dehydro-3-deoxygalactonokinase